MESREATFYSESVVYLNVVIKYIFRGFFFLVLLVIFGVLATNFQTSLPKSWNPNVPYLEMIAFIISFHIYGFFLPFSKNFRIKSIIKKMGFDIGHENDFIVGVEKTPCDHEFMRRFFDKTDDIGVLNLDKHFLEYSGDQYYFKLKYEDLVGIRRVGLRWVLGMKNGKKIQIVFLHKDERVSFIFNDRSQKTFFAAIRKNDPEQGESLIRQND